MVVAVVVIVVLVVIRVRWLVDVVVALVQIVAAGWCINCLVGTADMGVVMVVAVMIITTGCVTGNHVVWVWLR